MAAVTDDPDDSLSNMLAAARNGDVSAFEAFYVATIRRMLAMARRICGEAHGDDATADAYFQAWATLLSYDHTRGTALAWLATIVRSRAHDVLRRERHRHGGQNGAPAFDPDDHACPLPGPIEQVETLQRARAVHSALRALPLAQQTLVGLAYFDDCSHDEIARQTGMPLCAVGPEMRRAHRRLNAALSPEKPVVTASRPG